MTALSAALGGRWSAPQARRVPRRVPLVAATVAGALVLAGVVAVAPGLYRAVLAAALLANVLIMAVKWPRAAAVTVLLFLPFLGLVRRLLIIDSGWSTQDPLLLVAPAAAAFLVYQLLNARGWRLQLDPLYKIVLGLGALSVIEAANPSGNGLSAGLGGLIFLAVPLLWFVIGRELADRDTVRLLLYAVVVIATASSAYGWIQTQVGMPSWDQDWIKTTGYAALQVGTKMRAFGSFPSAAEYAAYCGAGLVVSAALVMHRRWFPAIVIPLMAVATFLASGRSVMVLTVVAVIFLFALKTRNLGTGTMVVILGVSAVFIAASVWGPTLDRISGTSSDPLVAHQLGGLLNPLDPQQSTLIGHLQLVGDGFKAGFQRPFGQGTGVTNIAASTLSNKTTASSEVDVTDIFISLGLVGGIAYLGAIWMTLRTVARRYAATRDPLVFAIAGLLIVTLGQWLNGGHYALAALSWFLIGWVTRPPGPGEVRQRTARAATTRVAPATNGHGDPAAVPLPEYVASRQV